MMDLPAERLPNIEEDLKQSRTFYTERHCRNLILQQHLEHTHHHETTYANRPRYVLDCLVKNFRAGDTTEIRELLGKLKTGICKDCANRTP
jgi:hypothetical protein